MQFCKAALMAVGFTASIAICADRGTAWAQQPASPPQTSPNSSTTTLKVSTQLTVEDVTVTDAQGKPVHGLTQSDFTIREDGKPQPLKNFQEYVTQIPSAQAALPKFPPGIYTNQPSSAPNTSAVNVLMLDEVTTWLNGLMMGPENVMYAQYQSMIYLKTMPPGTQMAILMLGNGLQLVQGFTSNRDVLLEAMNSVNYESVPSTYVNPSTMPSREEACMAANRQSQLVMDALAQAATFLSGIQGRKNLIWFTPGIPWLTNYAQFSRSLCFNDYTAELQKVYAMLTAAQVALYPINPGGVGICDDSCDSRMDFAEHTGGVASYNRNDLDAAIGEAIATGSDYYSLSYVPPLAGYDGKYHTIDVKVDHPGLHLQYRKGYTSLDLVELTKSIAQPAAKGKSAPTIALPPAVSQFRADMALGVPPSTQLLLAVRVVPAATPSQPATSPVKGDLNPKLKPKALIRYDILYSIPAGQVTVADGPNGTHTASVELDLVAYGEDGTKLNVLRQTANVTIKPERIAQFQQNPFEVPLQLDLPPGKLFLRVGALDVPSGKAGTLEIPETVAKW